MTDIIRFTGGTRRMLRDYGLSQRPLPITHGESRSFLDTDGRNQMKPTRERSAGRSVERRAPRASCVRSVVRQYEYIDLLLETDVVEEVTNVSPRRYRVAKSDIVQEPFELNSALIAGDS